MIAGMIFYILEQLQAKTSKHLKLNIKEDKFTKIFSK